MEEKRTGTPPPAASPAATDSPVADAPPSSRRRGGNQKRKASSSGGNASNSQATKRQAREKPPPAPFPPIHNGPLTRARQQPSNSAASGGGGSPLSFGGKSESEEASQGGGGGGEMVKVDELNQVAKEDWEALEARIEADYEVIRSRGANVHVVPNHAGWFSWTKIHEVEKKTLLPFFSGKMESRTPEIYMEIRNWIMKKFHSNPNTRIELKDLSDIPVGDMDSRQEVMEFLDYWGLINYHPFPGADVAAMSIDEATDKEVQAKSMVGSLFQFETEQSSVPITPRNSVSTPSVPTGLFPDSSIAEELVKSEGPGVEYHCNSCSADCSRKRYHCQKQADFDLCSECFTDGKFSSDMSPSDFIIMEAAEAGGSSGGNWTDQETLLLLEALELFSENWSEIAEHVATKTKAQCILHFAQMAIEDTFLDSSDEIEQTVKNTSDSVLTNNASALEDDLKTTESNNDKANIDESLTDVVEPLNPEVDVEATVPNTSDNFAVKADNLALRALTEAFEAVGASPVSGERLSFSEAGNPVMTVVAFLVRLLEPNAVTASARSSLKSISGYSSGDQLALRHCFCLEDPPEDKKSSDVERDGSRVAEHETPKGEEQDAEKQEGSDGPAVDGVPKSDNKDQKSSEDCISKGETLAPPSVPSVDNSVSGRELSEKVIEEPEPTHINESKDPDLSKESVSVAVQKSEVAAMEVEVPPGFEKEPDDAAISAEPSTKAPKDDKMLTNMEVKDPAESAISNSAAIDEGNEVSGAEANTPAEEEKCISEMKKGLTLDRMRPAAITALSAAAVKAKFLADQEEEFIHRLAAFLIEKQLQKLEMKLVFFNDMENVVMRVREQMERAKQRLFHERAQIIATRLGISASRSMTQSLPINRVAMAIANAGPRPIVGNSVQSSNQDQLHSVGTK